MPDHAALVMTLQSPILYGISNCDTVCKAREWLERHSIEYRFHDFRESGLSAAQLEYWTQQVSLEVLLNKRSSTYRKVMETHRASLDIATTMKLMLSHPTLIKRPVLEQTNGQITSGFSEEKYKELFGL